MNESTLPVADKHDLLYFDPLLRLHLATKTIANPETRNVAVDGSGTATNVPEMGRTLAAFPE